VGPYIRDQRTLAYSRVERSDHVSAATVKALLVRQLVSLSHETALGDKILRINERGRAAVRRGHGQGLEYRCPECFGLIAPHFPLHDCPKERKTS
jgi:hypothetical protein